MSDRFGAISINPPAGNAPAARRQQAPPKPRPHHQHPKKRPPSRQSSRTLWLLAIPLILLLLYAGIGFLFGSTLIIQRLNSLLEENFSTSLQTREARFNPFTLRLQLSGATFAGIVQKEHTQPFLTIDQITIDLDLISLLRGSVTSSNLDIHGLNASIVRNHDKSYNLPAPTKKDSPHQKDDSLSLAGLPLHFALNNIKIRDSKVLFDDQVNGRQHRIEQIQLDLPSLSNFSFHVSNYITPHFSGLVNGSPVELTGETALPGNGAEENLKTNLVCNIQDLDLPLYYSYLPEGLPIKINKGKAQGKIQITFLPQEKKGGQFNIGLQLSITDGQFSAAEHLVLTAPSAELTASLRPLEREINIQKLLLKQPLLSADRGTAQRDLATLFTTTDTAPVTDKQPHRLSIGNLVIEDGALQFTQPAQENTSPEWSAIKLEIQGYQNSRDQEKEQGSFKLSAGSNASDSKEPGKSAAINWSGGFNSRGIPEGRLEAQNIPARSLLDLIDLGLEATGTANLQGSFSYAPGAAPGCAITLTQGKCKFQHLQLSDGEKPWLTADTLQLDNLNLRDKELDLGKINIQQGKIILTQGRLPAFLAADTPQKIGLNMEDLEFTGSANLLPAHGNGHPLQLSELHIKAGRLSVNSATQNNLTLSASFKPNGTLQAEGLVSLFPLRSSLALKFNDLPLADIAPWLPGIPLFQYASGDLKGSGNYHFPDPGFTGNFEIDSAVFRANDTSQGLKAAKITAKEFSIKNKPLKVGITELALDHPICVWFQGTDSPGPVEQIRDFLHGLMGKTAETDKTESTLPMISIITFHQGTINNSDNRLDPPWSQAFTEIEGKITGLHEKAGSNTRFDITGSLAATPFSLTGSADFLGTPANYTSTLEIHGLPLLTFAPQIPPLLALDPSSGSVDLLLNQSRKDGKEQGDAQLLLADLRPKNSDADSALPLALLNDSDSRIHLNFPLNDSRQPLFKQAEANFGPLLAKAAVAPLVLAGDQFSKLQDKQALPFAPGSPELVDPTIQEILRQFAALLASHTRLGLSLTGMADPQTDRQAIRQKLEEKEKLRVDQINGQHMQEWQRIQAKKKQQPLPSAKPGKIIEQNIPAKELAPPAPVKPKPVTVSDADLHNLAQERALQVFDFLTAIPGISSERIAIQDKTLLGQPGSPGNQVVIGLRALPQRKE